MTRISLVSKIICLVLCAALLLPMCACSDKKDNKGGETSGNTTASVNENGDPADSESTGTDSGSEAAEKLYSKLTVNVKQNPATSAKAGGKDDVAVFLIIGQSNFTTTVGAPNERTGVLEGTDKEVSADPVIPPKGTCYSGTSLAALDDAHDVNKLVTSGSMGGFCPSFGTTWNGLTGNKVVFVQAAVGAVGMHEWVPTPQDYYCSCSNNGNNQLYSNAISRFKSTVEALKSKYNIVTKGYIWNQGEHEEVYGIEGNSVCDIDSYYGAYKYMHESLMKDLGLDFGSIVIVRNDKCSDKSIIDKAEGSMSLDIARVAQYRACNTLDKLYLISRIPETCDVSMMTMYNGGGIHYNQNTFNLMGADAAENLYKAAGYGNNAQFTGVSVYNRFGKKLVSFDMNGNVVDGDPVVRKISDNEQLLAVIEPLGTTCTWTLSSDKNNWDENGYVDWSVIEPEDSSKPNVKYVKLELNYLSIQ